MTMAIPWYRSRITQGLLTVLFSQVVRRIQSKYSIDLSVWGTSVVDLVNGTTDGLSLIALYWAAHARLSPKVPIPPVVTLTKSAADELNEKEKQEKITESAVSVVSSNQGDS